MVEFLLFALILLAIPIVLPIVAWVSTRRTRTQLETLVRVVELQAKEIEDLRARVAALGSTPPPSAAQAAAQDAGSASASITRSSGRAAGSRASGGRRARAARGAPDDP